MEVSRSYICILFLSAILLSACAQNKSSDSVFPENTSSSSCSTDTLLKNKFIVNYEDGRIEVVEMENREVFVRHFLEPKLDQIKHVEYDQLIVLDDPQSSTQLDITPNNSGLWGPGKIQADSVWAEGIDGTGVLVGVVDAAVDYDQPQLATTLARNSFETANGFDDDGNGLVDDEYGWDFYDNQPKPIISLPANSDDPKNEHGSHVAGIILADPSKGSVKGVAYGAKLIPANFMNSVGAGTMSGAVQAVRYVASRGAKVINASWGGYNCSATLRQTIADVSNNGNNGKGILFVAAAGNDGVDFDRTARYTYPAVFNFANQLTIAATNVSDAMANFSNRSYNLVHFAAPGVNILSTVPTMFNTGGVASLDGTSMAAPMASGAAALLWSARPDATAAQIKQALMASTDAKLLKVSTQGRLNVRRALEELRRILP